MALGDWQLSNKTGEGLEAVVGDRFEDGTNLGAVDDPDGQVVVVGKNAAVENGDRFHFSGRIFVGSDLKRIKICHQRFLQSEMKNKETKIRN